MKQVTTYVGVDAHKKDLFGAMLIGAAATPVTWQLGQRAGRRARPGPGARRRGNHRRGRIPKMDNALVRRIPAEARWHYQHRPGVGRALKARRTEQPARR